MNIFIEYIFLSHAVDKYFRLTDIPVIPDVVHNHKVFSGTNLCIILCIFSRSIILCYLPPQRLCHKTDADN